MGKIMEEKRKGNGTMITIFVIIALIILGVIYFVLIKNDEHNNKSSN